MPVHAAAAKAVYRKGAENKTLAALITFGSAAGQWGSASVNCHGGSPCLINKPGQLSHAGFLLIWMANDVEGFSELGSEARVPGLVLKRLDSKYGRSFGI